MNRRPRKVRLPTKLSEQRSQKAAPEPAHDSVSAALQPRREAGNLAALQRVLGNRRLVQMVRQASSEVPERDLGTQDIHPIAAAGVRGRGETLPYLDRIQASFGKFDVTGARAFRGAKAARASRAIHAEAYTLGEKVAFAKTPSLHTTAHEAAHVVQQRTGVSLKGGVGQSGDQYEQHADRVADAVVQGRSAEALLANAPSSSCGVSTPPTTQPKVQRKMGMEFQTVSSKGPKVLAIGKDGTWKKANKGHGTLISRQDGWKLEKDERDLEFITDAIDEQTAPKEALSNIIKDMYTQTAGWLEKKSFEVGTELAEELSIDKSNFTTFVALNRRDSGLDTALQLDEKVPTYLIGFPEGANVYGSPQVTMGVRLTKLAKFFEDMTPDKSLDKENPETLGGGFGVKKSTRRTKQLEKMQSFVSLARSELSAFNKTSTPPLTTKVRGVLMFAIANLGSAMGHHGGTLFKDTTAFMHRTSFAGMYKTFKLDEKKSYKYFLTNPESPLVQAFTKLYHKGLDQKVNTKYFGKTTVGEFFAQLAGGKDPWVVKHPTTKQVAGLHKISEFDRRKYGIHRETDIGHDTHRTKRSGAILEIRSLPRTTLSALPALAASLQAYLKKLHE